jgi:hypothetical protein
MIYLHPVKNLHISCLRVESRSKRIIGNYSLNLMTFSSIWFTLSIIIDIVIFDSSCRQQSNSTILSDAEVCFHRCIILLPFSPIYSCTSDL